MCASEAWMFDSASGDRSGMGPDALLQLHWLQLLQHPG